MYLGFRSSGKKILRRMLAVGFIFFVFCLPEQLFDRPLSTVLLDRSGQLLGAVIADDGQWRFASPDSIPEKFSQCITTFEDRHFWQHSGVYLPSIGRAALQNIRAKRVVSGGSTLTMQVIRMSRSNPPRGLWEKLTEMIRAVRLETRYSKEEILMMYATHAPMGGNVVGLEAASWRYFGRDPHALSWAETATLAVLPNAPSLIFPGKNQHLLKEKRNRLLSALHEEGLIDKITYELSIDEPLPGPPKPLPQLAPHLLDEVRKSAEGSRLVSSLESEIQQRALATLERYHHEYEKNNIHNAAALIVSVQTGEIIAHIGNTKGTDPAQGHSVNIINKPRSSGSILKPFLYAAMIHDGIIAPEQLVFDAPVNFGGFTPENFDKTYSGAIPANQALSKSLNIPATNMLQQYGVAPFQERLKQLGFSQFKENASHYGLSLVLGGGEVTLEELAGAYRGMAKVLVDFHAQDGKYSREFQREITWERQEYRATNSFSTQPALFNAGAVWSTVLALEEVIRPGSETGWEYLSSAKRIAWKTGTSYGFRDAWAVGITPDYVVAVWVGNADGVGRPGIVGTQAAAPIMFELFDILGSTSWFSAPYDDLAHVPMCTSSGMRASRYCHHVDSVFIPRTSLEAPTCSYHVKIHLDAERKHQVSMSCSDEIIDTTWFVLPVVPGWYYAKRNFSYAPPPPWLEGCDGYEKEQSLRILRPVNGTRMHTVRGLDGVLQDINLEAIHTRPEERLHWHIDAQYLGSTIGIHQMHCAVSVGKHTLIVLDEDGNQSISTFEVED